MIALSDIPARRLSLLCPLNDQELFMSGGYYHKEDGKPALFRDAFIFDVERRIVTRHISDNVKIFHKQKSLPVV